MLPGEDSWQGPPTPEKAHAVAKKTLQRLKELNSMFPSEELAEAIRQMEAWHEKYQREET
jgi:hypothetical protein